MITIQEIMDVTNLDLRATGENEYGWFEDTHDLNSRIIPKKGKNNANLLIVKGKEWDWEIELGSDWKEWIALAIDYASFSKSEGWATGSVDHFWAMARAVKVFGHNHLGFSRTAEGAYTHVGDRMFFLVYENGRYDLFDDGYHTYAGTTNGLLNAYEKLSVEIDAWAAIRPQD